MLETIIINIEKFFQIKESQIIPILTEESLIDNLIKYKNVICK